MFTAFFQKLISGARTLTEVENLQNMLQTGRIPVNNHYNAVNKKNIEDNNLQNEQEDEEDEEMEL